EDLRECMQILAQLPQQKRYAFTLAFERCQDAAHAGSVAREPGLGELEHVEASDIGHRALDRVVIEVPVRQQQAELLDLLARSKQIALGRVGKELQRIGGDALVLTRKARCEP